MADRHGHGTGTMFHEVEEVEEEDDDDNDDDDYY